MNTKKIAIAIDGPAGAGKSSISKVVANELGYLYIDTGAMYRGVTWAVLDSHVDVNNQKEVEALLPSLDLTLEPTASACKVYVKGQDVTDLIRQQQINENVSTIASYKGVREYLVERQQAMAAVGGVILDGRDIGSVVLPNAELKIYLTASVDARAKRRWLEVQGTSNEQPLEDIKKNVESRDEMDKNRDESPLVCVEDAIVVDSSNMTFDETVKHILHLVQERI
ncbi:cytidylate kinase [Veillonella dispar ATCC 17748]|jgi:cytidylate kinase|uniref:Cytidylate kinase n=1 Tax=Veillonella dispar ATCC 17748 TaxID=546273 RepID=C4FR42_9FIRM|nr:MULTISPECIES: (d)CMP kinase [Veillonella]MDU2570011.1 (d)CMP kinase [Veillonella sp.]EEP65385.1 cytidylate kinase [Veillonella dispar ATCC 17748]MBS6382283.1 (d)CMP kinase [Veillonella dispar]MDU7637682.1 (d)CMP kinase [Veillonella dispar]RGZ28804.1 (d)CMP kinase [Veillonella sp. AM51-8BH]